MIIIQSNQGHKYSITVGSESRWTGIDGLCSTYTGETINGSDRQLSSPGVSV